MQFRIADTFTDSLATLTGEEQKAVKTTAFDLQLNPATPGMQFHKLDRARDKNFWSVRVNRDIRLIVHRTNDNLLLCYVDHHDAAYKWAERRKLETHPKTGAAQLVEIRETVKEITIPAYVSAEPRAAEKTLLFESFTEEELLGFGVPAEWLDDVKTADEDALFEIAGHLPNEAAEALLEIATGGTPVIAKPSEDVGAFEHPDAKRRFRLVSDVEELRQALDYPWEKWLVFLHPAQRDMVERSYSGPARVAGSAGTGKTVVAIHRAAHLALEHPESRLLLTTFSRPLAVSLEAKLRRVLSHKPTAFERIEIFSINDVAKRLYEKRIRKPAIVSDERVRELLEDASSKGAAHRFSKYFIWSEWRDVVDAWQLKSWEEYRDVQRLGRKTKLPENQREVLWSIFSCVQKELSQEKLVTIPMLFAELTANLQSASTPPYEFIIVDEAQDVGVPQLRLLAAMGTAHPDSLFFAGDLGQRIFQTPFSWKSLGVDVRGRSKTLRVNYRTSHQIRLQADRLLPDEISDIDGITEDRRGTVSAFNGPEPQIYIAESIEDERQHVSSWLSARTSEGTKPEEIGVFVRSKAELERARKTVTASGLNSGDLNDGETRAGFVTLLTMHLAKGLEFRAVVVMACDDEVLPSQSRIESVGDDAELEEVYSTERHLLYVACTRARDQLLVTGTAPASEFIDDFTSSNS